LLVDPSVLCKPRATTLHGGCSEFPTITLRRKVPLDRFDRLVVPNTPVIAGIMVGVPWGIVAKTHFLDEEFLDCEVMMLLKSVGEPGEAVVSQPLVAGTTMIWVVIDLSHRRSNLTVVEIDQLVE